MNFQEAVALAVGALCEAFSKQATDGKFTAYEWGLEGLTAEEVHQATRLALQRCRFMPSPAELRELVASAGDGSEARAMKAWLAVDLAVQQYGRNKTVDFDDPLVNATIRMMGGWLRFCDATVEDFDKWLRKDFLATYSAMLKSPPGAEVCLPSPGQFVRENGFHHEYDELVSLSTGLDIGPLQRRLAAQRGDVDSRREMPRVEFQKP